MQNVNETSNRLISLKIDDTIKNTVFCILSVLEQIIK